MGDPKSLNQRSQALLFGTDIVDYNNDLTITIETAEFDHPPAPPNE
jgi:hypothetical protein